MFPGRLIGAPLTRPLPYGMAIRVPAPPRPPKCDRRDRDDSNAAGPGKTRQGRFWGRRRALPAVVAEIPATWLAQRARPSMGMALRMERAQAVLPRAAHRRGAAFRNQEIRGESA